MSKKKRVKYNAGGALSASKSFKTIGAFAASVQGSRNNIDYSLDYQTPKQHHSFGVQGSSKLGITKVVGSTGTDKHRIKARVGVNQTKGDAAITASRNINDGEISATIRQQPKHFSYGKETFVGVEYTRKF